MVSLPDQAPTTINQPPTPEEGLLAWAEYVERANRVGQQAVVLANTNTAGPRGLGRRSPDYEHFPRLTDTHEREAAFEHLEDHLTEISADPSGSDPEPYVSPETMEMLERFGRIQEAMPEDRRWKGATVITHDDLTFRWFRRRTLHTPLQDASGNEIKGKRIGYLNVGQFEAPVLYCSDGKLRMLIKTTGGHGRHSQQPEYSGYSRLPDLRLAMPLRGRGEQYLVSYKHNQSKTLKEELGLKS